MFERFTERSRQVVVLAQDESRALRHNYIGTEHLLLGLLRENDGLAAKALNSAGFTLETTRQTVIRLVGEGTAPQSGQIPFTREAQTALNAAASEATSLRKHLVGTDHLLLGLLRIDDGPTVTLLASHAEEIRRQIERLSPAPYSGTANEIADAVAAAADQVARAAQLAADRDWYEQAAEIRDAERTLRDLLRRLLPLLNAPPTD